ncbi:rho-associated protein kinase 2-like [Hemiscyllium ocellatum]|uniref:rho-associated protein kinase 2-like n=1 Tax=Hemiscyllium ocellatum TaxID=170820 RepID=UPI002966A2CF|nr:rho-associated protein kinase 2-like [Hemiscyllium ocellatum]XP_060686482.1 rho-associated protein kinase 2-like [Hemiscyllium ocellatum]
MNWDTQLNSILNDTDCNVEKIKKRLNTTGYYAKVGSIDKMEHVRFSDPISVATEPSSYSDMLSYKLPKEELMGIYRQLQSQGKTIEFLQQALLRVETEKVQQMQKIRSLEEDIRRLQSKTEERCLDFQLERKMEEWRRGMSNEIYSLREQVQRVDGRFSQGKITISSLMQEVQQSKKDLCEEHDSLRREIDHLKHKIRRQEDELLNHISDTRELKQSQEKSSKILRELMSKYQLQLLDSNKSVHEREYAEQELTHIRSTVAGLKEQLRNINLADNQTSTPSKPDARKQYQKNHQSMTQSLNEDSDSNLSCTLSLVDISSDDDISSLQDLDLDPPHKKGAKYRSALCMEECENEPRTSYSDEDFSVDLGGLSDNPPELTLSDLS